MSFWQFVLFALLFARYDATPPTPVINLHEGIVQLNQEFMEPQYDKNIVKGQPYTLEIYMGNVDEYDYMVDYCVANDIRFIDNYGCLRPDNVFREFRETEQYSSGLGALKRTLVYFYPQDVYLNIQCQITIISCRGCAERSCNKHPQIPYPTYTMPIQCTYPISQPYALPPTLPYPVVPPAPPAPSPPLPYPVAPPGPPPIPPRSPQRCTWCLAGLPWWLWLIFLVLLLVLLCLLFLLLLCCCIKRRRQQKTAPESDTKHVFTIEKGVQSGYDATGSKNKQMDRFGSVRLRDENPAIKYDKRNLNIDNQRRYHEEEREEVRRRREQILEQQQTRQLQERRNSEARRQRSHQVTGRDVPIRRAVPPTSYDNHNFEVYEEDGMEQVTTESRVFYENYPDQNQATEISAERSGGGSYASSNPSIHLRLQRELQDNQRMRQRRETSEDYRQESESIQPVRSYRHHPIHHSHEALREDTVRTMRQSSVI
ncbi:unnamed protein product [Bursaphelenchus okinawaensis]|uniref:ZP domain-containing protein n=1 Tax=Bursaphelenchus okinawaensis TaxID=465554 RepID=A0A811KJ15_9BILA|nr:unnamed protein product [Bursaphelenchus okinawaensis]CAG9104225.1 unnamed protein product [Bursaphelenchus okinawaensis]